MRFCIQFLDRINELEQRCADLEKLFDDSVSARVYNLEAALREARTRAKEIANVAHKFKDGNEISATWLIDVLEAPVFTSAIDAVLSDGEGA